MQCELRQWGVNFAGAHSGKKQCGKMTEWREGWAERRGQMERARWLPLASLTSMGHTLPSWEHTGVTSVTLACQVFPCLCLGPCSCCFHCLELTPDPKQAFHYLQGWPLLILLISAACIERSSLTAVAKVTLLNNYLLSNTLIPSENISQTSSHFYALFTGSFSVAPSRIENSMRTETLACSLQYYQRL